MDEEKKEKKNTEKKKPAASTASVHSIDPEKVEKKPTQTQWIRQKKRKKIKSYRNESNYIALYNTHIGSNRRTPKPKPKPNTYTVCRAPINVKKKLYWPNLNSSDAVKNYFVHIAIGEQSIVPKTHHSAHCFGMHPCARWKKSIRMIGLVSFPNLPAAHITSLLFITASWKKKTACNVHYCARREKPRNNQKHRAHCSCSCLLFVVCVYWCVVLLQLQFQLPQTTAQTSNGIAILNQPIECTLCAPFQQFNSNFHTLSQANAISSRNLSFVDCLVMMASQLSYSYFVFVFFFCLFS